MDIIGALLHSSPHDLAQMLYGLLVGALVLSAMAMSSLVRTAAVVAASGVLLFLVFTQGPLGVERLCSGLLAVARQYEFFVRGVAAGKLLTAILWQLNSSLRESRQ